MKQSNSLLLKTIMLLSVPLLLVVFLHSSRLVITPNDQFFELQKGEIPSLAKEEWNLNITGKVKNQLMFNYENFTALSSKSLVATLECVEGPFGTAEWKGIPLIYILELAEIEEDAYDVVFYAADNYSDSLNLEEASADNILLAFQMNGEPLPEEHGFPVRLVTPDHYGYKWVKWIVKIEVVNYDYIGFWEERGWSDDAMRSNFSDWIVHAYLFTITLIFGGLAIISGYKFGPKDNIFRELPAFVTRRFHMVFSALFFVFTLLSFLYWGISTILLRGHVFYSLHGIVSLIMMIILGISVISGLPVISKRRKGKIIHKKISDIAFFMFAASVIFGLLIAFIGGFRLNQSFLLLKLSV